MTIIPNTSARRASFAYKLWVLPAFEKASSHMKYFLDFLRQKAPRAGKDMPAYYHRALVANEVILAAYFLIIFFVIGLALGCWEWFTMAFYAGVVACLITNCRVNVRVSLGAYALIVVVWVIWHARAVGWGTGSQHFLIPVLLMVFFNIYDPPWVKIIAFVVLISVRMALFAYSLHSTPTYALDSTTSIVLQTVNSLTLFITLAADFILLSSSIQDTERQLRIDNQELHKEAGTDPLTQLPNRRAMIDEVERFLAENPMEQFSIAIADIDFFKKVNDTYGHNGGDHTLRELAKLFKESAGETYKVCRWGGEEFCFFMPGLNLDQAGAEMFQLSCAVRKMPVHFDGNDFFITITIGVAENDFVSTMSEILEQADQKLYRGKISGRNCVEM